MGIIKRKKPIRVPLGYCVQCDDQVLKPVIGKRDKALCPTHYKTKHRRTEQGKKDDREFSRQAKEHLKEFPDCVFRLPGCTGRATQVHHARGRGIYLLDKTTYRGGCDNCHRKAEVNPELAYSEGFSEKRLDKYD